MVDGVVLRMKDNAQLPSPHQFTSPLVSRDVTFVSLTMRQVPSTLSNNGKRGDRRWRAARLLASATCFLWAFGASSLAGASITLLGPTPYLSAADSPFPIQGPSSNFYLEDFENDCDCIPDETTFCGGGEFNAFGAELSYGSTQQGWSVDGDDGVIDGLGSAGASGVLTPLIIIGSEEVSSLFEVAFHESEPGFLPNPLGFVLTGGTAIGYAVYDSLGARHQVLFPVEQSVDLTASDDRFFGIISSVGIARFEITERLPLVGGITSIHIDHFQYGLSIPEPASLMPAKILILTLALRIVTCRTVWLPSLQGMPMMFPRRQIAGISAVLLLILGHLSSSRAGHPQLLFQLTSPQAQPGAEFGQVLAGAGGKLLVGEPSRFNGSIELNDRGRAYLFDVNSGAFETSFQNPEPAFLDDFGGALAGGDGRVYVSTQGLEERVYEFDALTGSLLRRFNDPDQSLGSFGNGLAYAQGQLLVSAPGYDRFVATLAVGRTYLFDTSVDDDVMTIPNPEPKRSDLFGSGIALSSQADTVIVGALLDDLPQDNRPDGDNPGRVWVLDASTGGVNFVIENPDANPGSSDWFGAPVLLNEDYIVVGNQEDGASGVSGAGSVYVFDRTTGSLLRTLFSPQLESNGEFGRSVALTASGHILVGAWGTSVDGHEAAGHAYLFHGVTGELLLDIPNPNPSGSVLFGWSVAAVGDRLIIGSPQDSVDGLPAAGSVFVYALVPEPSGAHLMATGLISAIGASRFRRRKP